MPEADQNRPMRFKARWVFPVTAAPIENGVIEVQQGLITAIYGHADPHAIDLGCVAVIPGLVNAHTHLEFSDLTQPVQPANPFTSWIRSLVALRRNSPATGLSIQTGLRESALSGTLTVGEIATQDWPNEFYSYPPVQSVVFREILGLRADQIETQFEVARRWLDDVRTIPGDTIRGISPHAPYSVHPDLYRRLIELAVNRQAPVAIHLAETHAELELLDRGTGEFVELLQQFQVWNDSTIARGTRPLDYLQPLADVTRALVIHGNYLGEQELNWLREHGNVSVVYCPRTHAYFGHSPHPWITMLASEINVAIGTDSRGSNPDLSLWNELRFLRALSSEVDPAKILELGTLAGAKALGLDAHSGSIDVGKRANLALAKLPDLRMADPYELLFSSTDVLQRNPAKAITGQ